MIGSEASPGRFERFVQALPEGAVLRGVLTGLVTLTAAIVGLDFYELMQRQADIERMTRTEPLPMERPKPGDQIRPYLPRTIPVGPDRGRPTLPGYDGPVDSEAMSRTMAFIAAGDGVATALGRIDPGTAEAFEAFLDAAQEKGEAIDTLFVHSPGGSVEDAIAMARLSRERGLATVVPEDGYCASACPLLFAGGAAREAGDGAWIGVHQVYAARTAGLALDIDRSIANIQQTIADCQQLLFQMGVDPRVWVKAMQTPPGSLYVLTEAELEKFNLVGRAPPAPAPRLGPEPQPGSASITQEAASR